MALIRTEAEEEQGEPKQVESLAENFWGGPEWGGKSCHKLLSFIPSGKPEAHLRSESLCLKLEFTALPERGQQRYSGPKENTENSREFLLLLSSASEEEEIAAPSSSFSCLCIFPSLASFQLSLALLSSQDETVFS